MNTLRTTAERAEDLLVALAEHLPPSVPIGRPLLVVGGSPEPMVLTADPSVWFIEADATARLLPLGGGRVELTRWRYGREVSRQLGAG